MSEAERTTERLRRCPGQVGSFCDGCPYQHRSEPCTRILIRDALLVLDTRDNEIEQLSAEIARLTAENRAKEQYIAEHMGGTAERNARMKRDAEQLRGTTAHANPNSDILLEDEYK